MRKFECKGCDNHCELTPKKKCFFPKFCPFSEGYEPVWHEVKEEVDSAENAQFGNSEQLPSNPRKLPDWVKVGAIGYDLINKEYFEIKSFDMDNNFVETKYFDTIGTMTNDSLWTYKEIIETAVQARKRPFNADEMKAMVGKVLSGDKFDYCALITYTEAEMIETQHYTYTSDELIDGYTIDGKPCFKLEHLNEKGEWVE